MEAPHARVLFAKPQEYYGNEEEPPPDTDRELFSLAGVVKSFVHNQFP
jgi:hypothetical protein